MKFKKFLMLLVLAIPAFCYAVVTYTGQINGYVAKGSTSIPMIASTATAFPTPFSGQMLLIHQVGTGTSLDETYEYTGLASNGGFITIGSGLLHSKYKDGQYLVYVNTAVVTGTPTNTATNTVTSTPVNTATPTPTATPRYGTGSGTGTTPVTVIRGFTSGDVIQAAYSSPCTACLGPLTVNQLGVTAFSVIPATGTAGVFNFTWNLIH